MPSIGEMGKNGVVWALFGLLFAATWWRPEHPVEQSLHHSLTLIAVIALILLQRRGILPTSSLAFALAFLALHTIAARWMYSYVPYDDWLHTLFGIRLSDLFGWHRNDFDRLVHFSYGLFLAPVLMAYFADRRGWRRGFAALAAVDIVVSTGALYEVFEWFIAITLAPDAVEAYNGQQGDLFDAQKDMAIAGLGALIAAAVWLVARRARARVRARSEPPVARAPAPEEVTPLRVGP
jgi:putative membrane protein